MKHARPTKLRGQTSPELTRRGAAPQLTQEQIDGLLEKLHADPATDDATATAEKKRATKKKSQSSSPAEAQPSPND